MCKSKTLQDRNHDRNVGFECPGICTDRGERFIRMLEYQKS